MLFVNWYLTPDRVVAPKNRVRARNSSHILRTRTIINGLRRMDATSATVSQSARASALHRRLVAGSTPAILTGRRNGEFADERAGPWKMGGAGRKGTEGPATRKPHLA